MGNGLNKLELRLRPELVTMQAQLELEDVEQVRFTFVRIKRRVCHRV